MKGQKMTVETERVGAKGGMEESFGFKKVDENQKQSMVNGVFHSVAKKYDIMNDVMSVGMHRLWKDAFVAWLHPSHLDGYKVLDVAGGTGDIAFRIVEASNRHAHATVLDINSSMLEVGKERANKNGLAPYLDFVEANAEKLPFEIILLTLTQLHSAFVMCRILQQHYQKLFGCLNLAGVLCVWNFQKSKCLYSISFMTFGRFTVFRALDK